LALLVDPTDVWLLAEDIELFESLVITDAVETIFPMQMIITIIIIMEIMMMIMKIVMMMRRIIIIISSSSIKSTAVAAIAVPAASSSAWPPPPPQTPVLSGYRPLYCSVQNTSYNHHHHLNDCH
jgi:hypothetical protein